MDYDLSRLNSRSFEQLIQGIAAQVLGAGLVIFGDGPDGGREASINARVPYPTEAENWEGEIVLQAKFRQRLQGGRADAKWALSRFRKELSDYAEPDSEREMPDYMILATNVTLSSVKDAGAKDRMFELAAGTSLRGFDIWDYDKLRVYLDCFEDLRRSFAAYVLPGDVLSEVVDSLAAIKGEKPEFDDAIARFLQKELLADQWANLEQAGRAADEQVPVSRVFVDLPFSIRRQPDPPPEQSAEDLTPGFAAYVTEAASYRLDPRALHVQQTGSEPVDRGARPPNGRVVLLGGPGQGKSTMGQFVCQMFRASLLRSRPPESLSPEVKDVLEILEAHCESNSLDLPTVKRFPLRVELSRFAGELGSPTGSNSLLEYLSRIISSRIQSEVSPALMATWLSAYPWLLILDGLDEVPASSNREELLSAIQEFWVDSSQDNADCLVIATTRPQGYSEEFSPRHYRHFWLAPLSAARAIHYADRLLGVRIPDDDDRRSKAAGRLMRAVSRADTARLMTSPLQVTIMATLLERMGQPPEGRWNLFSQYYRVLYDRELERDIPAASVLRDYKPDIDAIHRRVGLLLQVESESPDQVDARISRQRFTEIVKTRLRDEEHASEDDDALARQIIDTAMQRLVFLVGLEADQVGFEIRSLQEFMAAEALLDGKDETVGKRLRAIAPLPTWRNVFLFAAGRCFADLQHLRDTVHTICVELNDPAGDDLAAIAVPGSSLAIDLLTDGVANRQPRYERLLGREALRILRRPPSSLNDQLAEVYRSTLRKTYEEELKTALTAESFSSTLAAWRTLAVLGARAESWAFDLAESRLPALSELGVLIEALPANSGSERLAGLLAPLCAAAPPSQSLPNWEALRGLGVVGSTPTWYRAFFGLVSEHMPPFTGENKIRFQQADASELVARLRSVQGNPPLERASEILGEVHEKKLTPSTWQPFVSALRFAESPSARTLAEELAELALVDDFADVRQYGTYAPWPLSSLLVSASNQKDLLRFASRARSGSFGDIDDWIEAEERWMDVPIQDVDLSRPADGALPFDATIGVQGFPLGAVTLTVNQERQKAAVVAIDWLNYAKHRPTRGRVTNVIFWLLGGFPNDSGFRLNVEPLVDSLRAGDVEATRTLHLDGLNSLMWPLRLGADEIRILEEVGADISHLRNFRTTTMDSNLSSGLLCAWLEDGNRVGIYRLLALGLPTGGLDDESAADLLGPKVEGAIAPARALLGLKLGERPTARALEVLAKAEAPWLESAIAVLAELPDIDVVADAIGVLDLHLGPDRWQDKQEIMALGNEFISRGSSGLANGRTWNSLELFERPRAT